VKRLILPLVLIVGLLALAPLSPATAKDNWTSVRSKNFHLVGNASEKEIRRIAVQLEQFRDVMTRVLAKVKTASSIPITVVVFKSDESFKPFRPSAASAYFQAGEDVNYIALTSERRYENPYASVFHEYVHFLVKNNTENVPLWFNEGLAEYYSSFDMMDGDKKVMIGKPISSHVHYLREQKLMPFETLFAVKHDSPIYNERDKKGVFYAEAWALVHYLLLGNDGKRLPQFKQFLTLLDSGAQVADAFKQAFQTDYRALEKELAKYIERTTYPVSVTTFNEKLEFDTGMKSAPLTEAEGQYYLGDLLLHAHQLDRAEKFLQQAVALDPQLAGAHASLGMLNVRRGRFPEAREHLKRAAAADTKNFMVHYYYAYMLSREAMRAGTTGTGFTPEAVQAMRAELGKAIELAPDYAESYHLLAFVNLVTGEQTDESIKLIRRAMQLEPGEQRFNNVLAQLYIRKQDYKTARKILEPVARGGSGPEVSAQAKEILEELTAMEERLAEARDERGDAGAEATEDATRPALRRRDEAGPAGGVEPQTSFQQTSLLPKRDGDEQVRGHLLRIDCDAGGVTMTIKVGERTLKLHNNELTRIDFLTYTQEMRGEISCGPRSPVNAVLVNYRPSKDARARLDGEVTAVAFLSKELEAMP
jgi:tetratricopeptide (TPR) repeat protein